MSFFYKYINKNYFIPINIKMPKVGLFKEKFGINEGDKIGTYKILKSDITEHIEQLYRQYKYDITLSVQKGKEPLDEFKNKFKDRVRKMAIQVPSGYYYSCYISDINYKENGVKLIINCTGHARKVPRDSLRYCSAHHDYLCDDT